MPLLRMPSPQLAHRDARQHLSHRPVPARCVADVPGRYSLAAAPRTDACASATGALRCARRAGPGLYVVPASRGCSSSGCRFIHNG